MGKSKYQRWYKTKRIDSWVQLRKFYEQNKRTWDQWIFRGQEKADWDLETSLERLLRRGNIDLANAEIIEANLLRSFKRELHIYQTYTPSDDKFEWLSIMQHHGAPTRLLDWTYSFFIAVYFALEKAEGNKECAVWALDARWFWKELGLKTLPIEIQTKIKNAKDRKEPTIMKSIYGTKQPFVLAINPFRLNERLKNQKGVFLAPGNINKSLMENIDALMGSKSNKKHLVKIVFSLNKRFLRNALKELENSGIHRGFLFPGLDGFAKGLESKGITREGFLENCPSIFDDQFKW